MSSYLTIARPAEAGIEVKLRSRGVVALDTAYDAGVRLVLGSSTPGGLDELVAELTAGAATPVVVGQRWVDSTATEGR